MHAPEHAPTLRDFQPGDAAARSAMIGRAFADAAHASGHEAAIAAALDARGAATVSLLALHADRLLGSVQISPVTLSSGGAGWFGLGPVAVDPACQRRGVGAALIAAALARLRMQDAAGCVVLGDPAYYARFGFAADARLAYPGVPAEYFQCLSFGAPIPEARVTYDAAFDAT